MSSRLASDVINFDLPYGKNRISFTLPAHRLAGILRARHTKNSEVPSPWELVSASMAKPYGTQPLHELSRGKQKIVLIASDHTRPVPSKIIVPQMLTALRKGNPSADITILIATGCHRGTTKKELTDKFGEDIVASEHIVIHDCENEEQLSHIGTLPSGGPLVINRLAAQADLLVSEGFIEPHFFAGFSGGRKSVLPGIASRRCVHYNHCGAFIAHPSARTGILDGNPIHADMLFAARIARLAFVVNVVLSPKGEIIGSFAGDCDLAHRAGADFVTGQMLCLPIPSDIVITSNNGYPLDQNLYQLVKSMATAEATCNDGGVIIVAGECTDGVGGDHFLRAFRDCSDISDLSERFRQIPPEKTLTDQWQSQILARILKKHPVIVISSLDYEIIRAMHMLPAASVNEAIQLADQLLQRKNAKVTIIPDGISLIVSSVV